MAATIADRQARNTDLANDAYRSVFNLRFSGEQIPRDLWDAITETLEAIDRWFAQETRLAPTKLTTKGTT